VLYFKIILDYMCCLLWVSINTLTPGLIQVVRKKNQLDRTWLCAGISPVLYRLRTWLKCQKTRQVF